MPTRRLPSSSQPAIAGNSYGRGGPTIHRKLVALPVVVLVFTIIAASAPVEARSRMALGVWMPDGNRDPSVYVDFGKSISPSSTPLRNAPAIWNASSQWGRDDTKAFPLTMARAAIANRAVLMVTWSPVKPPLATETGAFSRFKLIAKGKHDAYIRNWARQAKKAGGPVLVRFAHEINVSYFPWTEHWGPFYNPETGRRETANDNSPYWFKKAWKRIYRIFQRTGARNAKFLWTVAKETCRGCNPFRAWYPGNKFVHYVGFSNFNWGGHFGGNYTTFVSGIRVPMEKLSAFTRKPVIVAELGTTDENVDGGKPAWIAQGYPAVYNKYPRIKGVVYQNVDLGHLGHPNWSLDSPAVALLAYEDIAEQWRFSGRFNKKGQVK